MLIKLVGLVLVAVGSVKAFTDTEGNFKLISNTRVQAEHVLQNSTSTSSSSCGYKCLTNPACRGFSYHRQTAQCEQWSHNGANATGFIAEDDNSWETWSVLPPPVDCLNIKTEFPTSSSGVFHIKVNDKWTSVFCDLDHDGGGWTVFQQRFGGSIEFYRGMDEYMNGFGKMDKEFWLGLQLLHILTINSTNTLYIEFMDFDGNMTYELYHDFKVGAGPGYTLTLGTLLLHNTTNLTSSDALSTEQICQFVSEVTGFSSEYGGSWSASQVIGEPNVYPRYGDISGAWTPSSIGQGFEYLQLRFNRSLQITNFTIYETYNSGAVKAISVLGQSNSWINVWFTTNVTRITSSRAFSPNIQPTEELVTDVRIEFDTSLATSYYEVDAIQVCGEATTADPNTLQYSDGAQFSTSDRDVDESASNFADLHRAGWWFKDCTGINPNGDYSPDGRVSEYNGGHGGVVVPGWKGVEPIKETKLMFRRQPKIV